MSDSYDIAHRVLGPVFRMFCFRLRLVELFKPGVPLLFLSRGGIRLRYVYHLYLQANKLQPLSPHVDFYVSRVAALRALLAEGDAFAISKLAAEYGKGSVEQAMAYLLPPKVHRSWHAAALREHTVEFEQRLSAEWLLAQLQARTEDARMLRDHLREQHALARDYFRYASSGAPEVLLVDTGWSGSIVKVMQCLFPDVGITACFFGRYNYGKLPPPWFDSITGVMMQHNWYDWSAPQSSIVLHRHLIETLCEPRWPSVASFIRQDGEIRPATGWMPEEVIAPGPDEEMARGMADYIASAPIGSAHAAAVEYDVAMRRLSRLLCFPSAREALTLGIAERSIDLGREGKVATLLSPDDAPDRRSRLRKSLWTQGQAALEFGPLRLPAQAGLLARRMLYDRAGPRLARLGARAREAFRRG